MNSIPFSYLLLASIAVAATPVDTQANRLIGSIPLRFEANTGQFDSSVRFFTRFSEQPVFLTQREAVLPVDGRSLRLRPRGANRNPRVEGVDQLRAKSAYMIGNQPSEWKGNAPHFGAVSYSRVYPGIDLIFRGSGQRLEYDFVVHPGSNPRTIQIELSGADRIRIDESGTLIIQMGKTELRQPKPFVYQKDSFSRPVQVAGGYRMLGRNIVGFRLGDYDLSRTLIIDPVIIQGTYLGGGSTDVAKAVTVDANGLVWVTGYTTSPNFPLAGGPFREERRGGRDVFVAVFDPSKTGDESLIYTTYLGGSDDDEPNAIHVDSNGTAYVAGYTASADYPIRNAYQDTNAGERDMFVSQINLIERGDPSLWYSTYIGGPQSDFARAVTVQSGRIYVAGYTESDNFPIIGSTLQGSRRGGYDAVFVQLDPGRAGTQTGIYSTYLGAASTDVATGIAVDSLGRVYLSGYSMSDEFPLGDAPYQPVHRGRGDLFLTRLDLSRPGLDALDYSTFLGGTDLDQTTAMTMDSAGRLYLIGTTFSQDFPLTPNNFQVRQGGASDVFVVRFDFSQPRGQELTYSTYLGGSATDVGYGVSVDRTGRIQVAGYTFSADFPVKGNGFQNTPAGGFDAFVAWLDPAAQGLESLACSTYLGGEGNEVVYGVAADAAGNVFVAGSTTSTGLGIPENAVQASQQGYLDGFLARVTACPARSQ